MRNEILFEANVEDLKKIDKIKRVQRSVALFAIQFLFIALLASFFGIIAVILFLIAMFTFLPVPMVPTPSSYKIKKDGVIILDRGRPFTINKRHRLHVDENRKFVSIKQRWRGEVLKLYTPKPKTVMKILEKLIQKS
ncbi:MAG: DUF2208 domain-containing protein [Nitrososphaeria archaeon]|nr:DUF2208 domain-containing protein [Nitrososphaeria archaeon]NIQ32162.1 DUF2208 domain-containing protein [Nitrososphaeria archaeon]